MLQRRRGACGLVSSGVTAFSSAKRSAGASYRSSLANTCPTLVIERMLGWLGREEAETEGAQAIETALTH